MNMNPGQLPTYKSLFPVLRNQTTYIHERFCTFSITITHEKSGNKFCVGI